MAHRFHGVGSVLEGDLLQDVTQGPAIEAVEAFSSLQSPPETHTWMEEACLEDGAGRCTCWPYLPLGSGLLWFSEV